MDFFSEDPKSVVNPKDMVMAFACPEGGSSAGLNLEPLCLVTFTAQDLRLIVESDPSVKPVEAWRKRNPRIYRGKGWVTIRAPYGAPGTVMLLEELVAFGVRRFVFVGYCGAIQEGIDIGALILPSEAVREEGTSYHYLPEGKESVPDAEIREKLSGWMERHGLGFHQGRVWTTDAPYRETTEKVRRYRTEGILAVEMEMAAVFAFGEARGVSVGAVLIVTDRVRDEEWRIDFLSPRVQSMRERVIECLMKHVREM